MFRATRAAPRFLASKGEACLYKVPISARSASSSTGAETAPGIWSSAYSEGERVSMIASKRLPATASIGSESPGFFTGKILRRERTRERSEDPADRVQPRRRLRLQD